MNIKNLWKEFRIWLGWVFKKFLFPLTLPISAVAILALILAGENYKTNIAICMIAFSVFVFLLLLIGKTNKPYNWRLVIEGAKEFQKKFGQNDSIEFWIGYTKQWRNGMPLHKLVNNYRRVERLKNELDKLIVIKDTIPIRIHEYEKQIQILKDEII